MGREAEETPKAKWTRYRKGMQSEPAGRPAVRPRLPRAAGRRGARHTRGGRRPGGSGPTGTKQQKLGTGRSEAAASHHLAVYREHTLRGAPLTFFYFFLFFFFNFLSF